MHVVSQQDIEEEQAMKKEEERNIAIKKAQKQSDMIMGKSMYDRDETY